MSICAFRSCSLDCCLIFSSLFSSCLSQHSGKLGNLNWLNGPMGYANAQRTLNIIRTVTEFLSQPEIKNVVPMFSVLNEPNIPVGIGMDHLQNFMAEVYTMVRNITGEGKGNGPIMTLHDGFMGLTQWQNFLRGSDRVFVSVEDRRGRERKSKDLSSFHRSQSDLSLHLLSLFSVR